MDAALQWHFDPVIMTLNAFCTFALNVSVFLVISHTSALTIRVAGVIKDWVVVLVSVYLFADTKLTVINIFGYVIGKYLMIFDGSWKFESVCKFFGRDLGHEHAKKLKGLISMPVWSTCHVFW